MKSKTRYIFVGLFVVGFGLAFIGGILWLGSGSAAHHYSEYVVHMHESVAGLNRDSSVKYYGVDVGRVKTLGLDPRDPRRVQLLLQIDRGTPVHENTVAILEFQGLTGLAYINLIGGSPDSPMLEAGPDQNYPEIKSQASIWSRLSENLGGLLDSLSDTSRGFRRLLNNENQTHLSGILADLHTLSAALASRSSSMLTSLDDLSQVTHDARKASAQLPQLISRLEDMADEMTAMGVALRKTAETGSRELERFSDVTVPKAQIIADDLQQAAGNLRRFSSELERNPAVLLQKESSPRPGPGEE